MPEYSWVARNNVAWTNFRLRDPDLRAEADTLSEAVHKKFRYTPWAMGTRGAVLGWLGRHDEAIDLLEQAYVRGTEGSGRAEGACCLTLSCVALGLHDQAATWLERARANDATCSMLDEVSAALAAALAAG